MRVLVVVASRHGATRGIAERITAELSNRGVDVALRSPEGAGDPADYDAFVIGSAVYAFHWLKEAAGFVRHNQSLLAKRPVWLFSSGPLGHDTVDAEGNDVRADAAPREAAEFEAAIRPRDHRVFFGAYDPAAKPIGLIERVSRILPATKDLMQSGDFRPWEEIDAWAAEIAEELGAVPAAR